MYKYDFVQVLAQRLNDTKEHRRIIRSKSRDGWRFVAAIPADINKNGAPIYMDLVFEKRVDDEIQEFYDDDRYIMGMY